MKVFISDKDNNKYTYYYGGGRESIECRSASEPMVVKSLEEHEQQLLEKVYNFLDDKGYLNIESWAKKEVLTEVKAKILNKE